MSTKITKFLEENLPCTGYIVIYEDSVDFQKKILTNLTDTTQLVQVLEDAAKELELIKKALLSDIAEYLLKDSIQSDIDKN